MSTPLLNEKRARALAGIGSLSDRNAVSALWGYSYYNTGANAIQAVQEGEEKHRDDRSACGHSGFLVNTYEYNFRRSASKRYSLMQGIKHLKGMSRYQVHNCMTYLPDQGAQGVEVVKRESGQVAFKNLKYCSSVWLCPVCSSRIASARRNELGQAVKNSGGYTALITFTLAHSNADKLEDLLKALRKALNSTKSGRWYESFLVEHEITASASSLEFTHGDNGWHPHIHWLIFTKSKPKAGRLQEQLNERFGNFVRKNGRYSSAFHGVNVKASRDDISGYISKWNIIEELSNVQAKRGRGESLTAWQLAQLAVNGDQEAEALWLEYAKATYRKKALQWSRGARELCGLNEEKQDDELAQEDTTPEEEHVITFTPEEWYFIEDHLLIGEMHHAIMEGGAQGANALMIRIRGKPLKELAGA